MNTAASLQNLVTFLLDGEVHHGSFVAGIEPTLGGLHCEVLDIVDHPIADLAGFLAPPRWESVGIVAEGSATKAEIENPYTDYHGDEQKCRICVVVDRFGTQMSELRMLGTATKPIRSGDVFGLIVDAARRCLGLATDPPQLSSSMIGAWAWIDAVVSEAIERDEPLGLDDLDALHPFAGAGEPVDMTELREAVWCGSIKLDGIAPIQAKWCDNGAFARWWTYQLIDLAELCDAAHAVLDSDAATHLVTSAPIQGLLLDLLHEDPI